GDLGLAVRDRHVGTITGSRAPAGSRVMKRTTQARRIAARRSTAIWKYPIENASVQPFGPPTRWPKNANRVTNTATSAASNARNSRRSGSTSANHGSSHRPYCGEYTLFVRRNSARIGKPRCHRGVSGSRATLTAHTRATDPTNATTENRLTNPVLRQPRCPRGLHEMNHRLSQSATRLALNLKNSLQAWNRSSMNGTSTASQAIAAAPAT